MGLAIIDDFDAQAWEKRLPRGCLVDRDHMIISLCRGRSVLHLGAADAPFHVEKACAGKLLHQKIRSIASEVVGIDSDSAAIALLRRDFAIDDIVHADATAPFLPIGDARFDVVLCCDVIEHVSNPGGIIELCKRHMHASSELVVTTINATAVKPALRALLGREAVHHEHTAYYSFGTLSRLLWNHGLTARRSGMFSYPTVNRLAGVCFRLLAKIAPGSADGIMVVASLGASRSR